MNLACISSVPPISVLSASVHILLLLIKPCPQCPKRLSSLESKPAVAKTGYRIIMRTKTQAKIYLQKKVLK